MLPGGPRAFVSSDVRSLDTSALAFAFLEAFDDGPRLVLIYEKVDGAPLHRLLLPTAAAAAERLKRDERIALASEGLHLVVINVVVLLLVANVHRAVHSRLG